MRRFFRTFAIDELTRKPSHSSPTLLALILRNPGRYQVPIDTVIHRGVRYRHARPETRLYQLAFCTRVVFAPSVALGTDYQAALQAIVLSCSLMFTCPRSLNMDR
jgi:hypothetical protein